MEAWTEDRVRHLLKTVANLPDSRRGYLLGARLGGLLRRIAPDFHANVLGDQRLTDLLRRFPDILTVRPDSASQDVLIEFPNLGPASRGSRVDRAALSSNGDAASEQAAVLDQLLWRAMVSNRNDVKWFVDLESLTITEIPVNSEGEISPETETARAPERFLAIPPIPQDELREVMREYVKNLNSPELKHELEPLIEQDDWYPRISDRLRGLGVTSWRLAHRRFVADRARAWLVEHGVRPERFIRSALRHEPTAARPRHAPEQAGPRPRSSERDIRALVLRAVSRMSEEELLDLRIPLRYLV